MLGNDATVPIKIDVSEKYKFVELGKEREKSACLYYALVFYSLGTKIREESCIMTVNVE